MPNITSNTTGPRRRNVCYIIGYRLATLAGRLYRYEIDLMDDGRAAIAEGPAMLGTFLPLAATAAAATASVAPARLPTTSEPVIHMSRHGRLHRNRRDLQADIGQENDRVYFRCHICGLRHSRTGGCRPRGLADDDADVNLFCKFRP
jgi:hypothetical protein